MAATNPFRVSDLIAKYGWKIMPYLSNLGVTLLAEAQILFVDSGHTNKLDADDGEHGHSFERPLATIDYAIDLLTNSEQGLIIVAPGHSDSLGDAQIDFDVIGVHLIGVGMGSLKPRIVFGNANSSVDIGANNVSIQNIDLLPSVTSILIGVHVESGVTHFHAKDVNFLVSDDAGGEDEFVKAVEMTSGNHDCVFENVKILAHASASQATHGLHIAAASDRLTLKNVVIHGPFSNGIVEDAAGVDHIVEDCSVDTTGTSYGFDGSSTFAKRVRNLDKGSLEDALENLIGRDDNDNVMDTSNVVADADGSVLERLEYVQTETDKIAAIDNSANHATAVPADPTGASLYDIVNKDTNRTYARATDSLEAIGDVLIDTKLAQLASVADGATVRPASVVSDSILAKLMGKGDPATIDTFDNTTDSLEAISEAVAAITFTAAVSQTPTARSLQDILEKDTSGNFSDADDSLEMISDKVGAFAGTSGAGAAESAKALLELMHTDIDAILADSITISGATLPSGGPTANSLARFIASGGSSLGQQLPANMSLIDLIGNYTGAYDDNQADDNVKAHLDLVKADCVTLIADAQKIDEATLGTPVSNSLAAYIASGGTGLGQPLPQSRSLVDIIGNYAGPYNGASAGNNIKADIDLVTTEANKIGTIVNSGGGTATIGGCFGDFANSSLVTRLGNLQTDADQWGSLANTTGTAELGAMLGDFNNVTLVAQIAAIVTDLIYQEQSVEKVATSTDDNLFTVTGEVEILSLVGIVTTTAIGGVQNRIKVNLNATDAYDFDFSTEVDTNADPIGTRYVFSAANPAVLIPLANGAAGSGNPQYPWVCGPGVIEQSKNGGDAGTTGQINWYLTYRPLSSDGAVAAA